MMFDKVRNILADILGIEDVESITMDSNLRDDLGADSLDAMQLLMEVEDEYQITIPDEEVENFNTVKDVVEWLENMNK